MLHCVSVIIFSSSVIVPILLSSMNIVKISFVNGAADGILFPWICWPTCSMKVSHDVPSL